MFESLRDFTFNIEVFRSNSQRDKNGTHGLQRKMVTSWLEQVHCSRSRWVLRNGGIIQRFRSIVFKSNFLRVNNFSPSFQALLPFWKLKTNESCMCIVLHIVWTCRFLKCVNLTWPSKFLEPSTLLWLFSAIQHTDSVMWHNFRSLRYFNWHISEMLQACLEGIPLNSEQNRKFEKLISFCKTRWVERHDALVR